MKSFQGPKSGKYEDIEEVLEWVIKTRNNDNAVTHDMLKMTTHEIFMKKGIDDDKFKASRGCAALFMQTNGISLRQRTTLCQQLLTDYTDRKPC